MKLRSFSHINQAAYFVIDYAILWASTVWGFKLSPSYLNEILIGPFLNPELYFIGYGMPAFMAVGLQLADLQRPWASFRPVDVFVRALTAIGLGIAAFAAVHALVKYALVGRYVIAFTWAIGTMAVLLSRLVLWKLAEHGSRNVVLYGTARTSAGVSEMVRALNLPIRIVAQTTLEEHAGKGPNAAPAGTSLIGFCREKAADEVVVEVPEALALADRRALSECTRAGIPVADLGLFYERSFGQVYVDGLREAWFWSYDPAHARPWFFAFKRVSDIAVSLAGVMAAAPLVPFIALAVKLQDRGPVYYSQRRVGRHGRLFEIYKFRTMRVDAEAGGARWAAKGDDRATSIGRWLRRTRLDELPQFWNILKGDMSFIGPRPERPEFVEQIERELPFYGYRHLVKPGLTGWAQINYPYGASFEDARRKLAYDLYYLKYAAATMDILIVFRTIVAMVKGAR